MPKVWLPRMMSDPDASVRVEIAQRLSPGLLLSLRDDEDWRVRYEVVSRIAAEDIGTLVSDSDGFVSEMARSRMANTYGQSGEQSR